MASKYNYYHARKVIEHGELIYEGGPWARFPARKPNVDENEVLIGILALGDKTRIGAVEITDNEVFDDFCGDYGRGWFCTGGIAYLYTIPKAKSKECRSRNSITSFKQGELENLISSS